MMENQNVRLAVTFIIGLIVGVGGYWLVAHKDSSYSNDMTVSNSDVGTTSDQSVAMQGDNGVSVSDQMAGNSVAINEVVLKNPGWVAIHDNVDGEPGRILGAKLFDAGTASGTVSLLRNTLAGKTYFAVIHSDDGDYRNFVPKTDKILMDSDGKMVMTQFTANN